MVIFIANSEEEANEIEKNMISLNFRIKKKGRVIIYAEPYIPSWRHKEPKNTTI